MGYRSRGEHKQRFSRCRSVCTSDQNSKVCMQAVYCVTVCWKNCTLLTWAFGHVTKPHILGLSGVLCTLICPLVLPGIMLLQPHTRMHAWMNARMHERTHTHTHAHAWNQLFAFLRYLRQKLGRICRYTTWLYYFTHLHARASSSSCLGLPCSVKCSVRPEADMQIDRQVHVQTKRQSSFKDLDEHTESSGTLEELHGLVFLAELVCHWLSVAYYYSGYCCNTQCFCCLIWCYLQCARQVGNKEMIR